MGSNQKTPLCQKLSWWTSSRAGQELKHVVNTVNNYFLEQHILVLGRWSYSITGRLASKLFFFQRATFWIVSIEIEQWEYVFLLPSRPQRENKIDSWLDNVRLSKKIWSKSLFFSLKSQACCFPEYHIIIFFSMLFLFSCKQRQAQNMVTGLQQSNSDSTGFCCNWM